MACSARTTRPPTGTLESASGMWTTRIGANGGRHHTLPLFIVRRLCPRPLPWMGRHTSCRSGTRQAKKRCVPCVLPAAQPNDFNEAACICLCVCAKVPWAGSYVLSGRCHCALGLRYHVPGAARVALWMMHDPRADQSHFRAPLTRCKRQPSFQDVRSWYSELNQMNVASEGVVLVIVGNKSDLADKRQVSSEVGCAWGCLRGRSRFA